MSVVCCGSSDAVRSPSSLPLPHSGDRCGFCSLRLLQRGWEGHYAQNVADSADQAVGAQGKELGDERLLPILQPHLANNLSSGQVPQLQLALKTLFFLGINPNMNYRAKSTVKMTTRGILKAQHNEGSLDRVFPTMWTARFGQKAYKNYRHSVSEHRAC